ncbi:MAG: hypothetical protein JNJ64_15785 [Flavobacteriales bacterium]|nr:hypothetical protein [Flavobacteriales bacterium]
MGIVLASDIQSVPIIYFGTMKIVSLIPLLIFLGVAQAQKASMTITDDSFVKGRMDRATKNLYSLLGAQHYSLDLKLPGGRKHEVVLVMRSVYKDSTASVDTLTDSRRWRRMLAGGAPFDPKEESFFIAQRVDTVHYKVMCRFGNMNGVERTIALPWPNQGYLLDEGLRSMGRSVALEIGRPVPFMVLTQPYPDPPPPNEAVVHRYCFGVGAPPEEWPRKYGVPHLFIFELTLLPCSSGP